VALQYLGLGPGVLLLSFLLLQEIMVDVRDKGAAWCTNEWAPVEIAIPGIGLSTRELCGAPGSPSS